MFDVRHFRAGPALVAVPLGMSPDDNTHTETSQPLFASLAYSLAYRCVEIVVRFRLRRLLLGDRHDR